MTRAVAAVIVVLLALGTAGAALADGDPASDELVYLDAYLPQRPPSKPAAAALAKQIALVYRAGERIKVAVIATRADLGSIPSLFEKPSEYAHFLSEEIATIYIGPLVVVMPDGYGIYDGGRRTTAEKSVLAQLAKPASARPDDLVVAAAAAVARLFAAGALHSKDVLRPFVTAVGARVSSDRLTVRYYAYDDSGRAAVALIVLVHGRTVLTHALAPAPTNISKIRTTTLRLPNNLSLVHARFCLTATDAAGNRSARSCYPIRRSDR